MTTSRSYKQTADLRHINVIEEMWFVLNRRSANYTHDMLKDVLILDVENENVSNFVKFDEYKSCFEGGENSTPLTKKRITSARSDTVMR